MSSDCDYPRGVSAASLGARLVWVPETCVYGTLQVTRHEEGKTSGRMRNKLQDQGDTCASRKWSKKDPQ